MRIARCAIFRFSLPLNKPVTVQNTTFKSRDGFILKLTDAKNHFGYGEISPLKGLSRESAAFALKGALTFRKAIFNKSFSDDPRTLMKNLSTLDHTACSSVLFGFETAFLNLLANIYGKPFGKLLNKNCRETIRVNALLSGTDNDTLRQTRSAIKKGFRFIKIKVGRGTLKDDARLVNALVKAAASRAKIICDANRAWSLSDAATFARLIGGENIEYIEEPLKDASQLKIFYEKTKLPIALDETLLEKKFKLSKYSSFLKAIVIKPQILGGFQSSLNMIHAARELGIKSIISSAFESSIGIFALANFSASLGVISDYAGLDTLKWFKNDLWQSPLDRGHGSIHLSKMFEKSFLINEKKLIKISND